MLWSQTRHLQRRSQEVMKLSLPSCEESSTPRPMLWSQRRHLQRRSQEVMKLSFPELRI